MPTVTALANTATTSNTTYITEANQATGLQQDEVQDSVWSSGLTAGICAAALLLVSGAVYFAIYYRRRRSTNDFLQMKKNLMSGEDPNWISVMIPQHSCQSKLSKTLF